MYALTSLPSNRLSDNPLKVQGEKIFAPRIQYDDRFIPFSEKKTKM